MNYEIDRCSWEAYLNQLLKADGHKTIPTTKKLGKLLQNPVDLEVNDYALAMDIAIYYAETIIKHNPQVQWTFLTKPKSYIYLNEPILHFEDENVEFNRNPRQLLNVIIQKIKKNKVDEQHLYNRFLADESLIIGENHFE